MGANSWLCLGRSMLLALCALAASWAQGAGSESTVMAAAAATAAGPPVAGRTVPPCKPGACPFAGQVVRVIVNADLMATNLREVKDEFEGATGARLDISAVSLDEHFANFISDVTNHTGKYDVSIAGAWWLGALAGGDFITSYDRLYGDPRFPKWNIDDVLPGPRSLLLYSGKKYMVANDHDGQVMYYRRDLFADARHQEAFKKQYGYALAVPQTWEQFRDVAEYFNGKDLNADGTPDHGVSLHLKVGAQGMFHFMSFSAPFVIGPRNPKLYWFDPKTMRPLVDSPGHVRALTALVDLVKFGPRDMLGWDLRQSWNHFLAGRAALTFTWGDLGALAQEQGSKIKGRIGAAPMPGTREYFSIADSKWMKTDAANRVGNVTGGSWAGVISRDSKVPEAAYYLLALMANPDKSLVYAARGTDGVDPGRYSQFLPPRGSVKIEDYLHFGWDEGDIRSYLQAYYDNYNNKLQMPYLRILGTFSYWQALDIHLAEAVGGQLSPEAALKAAAVDFEEITLRLGREEQLRVYRASMGL